MPCTVYAVENSPLFSNSFPSIAKLRTRITGLENMSSNYSWYPQEELNTRPHHRSVKTPSSKRNDTTGNSTQYSFTLYDEWKKIVWVGFRDARDPKQQADCRTVYPPQSENVLPRIAAVVCILSREAVDVNGVPLLPLDVSSQLCKLLLAEVNSQMAASSMELLHETYGIQGDTFEYIANGYRQLREWYQRNPNRRDSGQCTVKANMLAHQDENIMLYELMNKPTSIHQRNDSNTTDENPTQPIEKAQTKRAAVADKTSNSSVKRVRRPLSPKPTLQTQVINPIHPRTLPQPKELPASGPPFARIQSRPANLSVAVLHHPVPTTTRTTTRRAKPKRSLNPLGSTLPPSVNANSNPAVSSSSMGAAAAGSSIGSSATTLFLSNPFLQSAKFFGLGSLLFVKQN